MEYVTFGGVRYAAPWPSRDLTDDEDGYLRQSLADIGVHYPVLTCTTPDHGPTLIQGRNRIRLGTELGIDVPHRDLGGLATELARKKSLDIQAAGRQLSHGEVEQARRQRNERIVAKREAGLSWREIAAEEDISPTRVKNIVRTNSPPPPSPAPTKPAGVHPVYTPPPVPTPAGSSPRTPEPDTPTVRASTKPPLPEADSTTPEYAKYEGTQLAEKHAKRTVPTLRDDLAWLLTTPHAAAVRAAARKAGHPIASAAEWEPLAVVLAAFEAAR